MKLKFLLTALLLTFLFGGNVLATATPPPLPGTTNFSIIMKTGWNMISIPANKKGVGRNNVFTPADLVGCNITALWKFNPQINDYVKPKTLLVMEGYWALVDSNCTATINGLRTSTSTYLYPGWNMISSKFTWDQLNAIPGPPPTPGSTPAIRCNLTSSIYYYDTTASNYIQVPTTTPLDDTHGYWVKVDKTCNLVEPAA